MIISLLVAAAENNAIGKNNQLLWHLPNDMKFFKNTTWGMPIIMGRKTFESIGSKPLAGRQNIVITRQSDWHADGTIPAKDQETARGVTGQMDVKELVVIGGGEIYRQVIDQAYRIYLTRVHAKFDADVFFPVINENEWKLVSNQDQPADEKHAHAYSFQLWERKNNY